MTKIAVLVLMLIGDMPSATLMQFTTMEECEAARETVMAQAKKDMKRWRVMATCVWQTKGGA